MKMLVGEAGMKECRKDEIMADAAYVILNRDSKARTGEFLIDEDVLREIGIKDFDKYAFDPCNSFSLFI